ncbi:MAG: hypothetical protein HY908_07775 [Myxococcales bacterium]|nr:hypothetical protein [Myxococcales bacterium]
MLDTLLALVVVAVLAGCGPGAEELETLRAVRDRVCACADAPCAEQERTAFRLATKPYGGGADAPVPAKDAWDQAAACFRKLGLVLRKE